MKTSQAKGGRGADLGGMAHGRVQPGSVRREWVLSVPKVAYLIGMIHGR